MTKQSLVQQARKQNRDAMSADRCQCPVTASLLRDLRDINMKHARAAK